MKNNSLACGYLNEELKNFWKWAEITPQEYALGKIPDKAVQTEWEDDYPGWPRLERAVDAELNEINLDQTNDFDPILEAIAVDNEGQYIIDKCSLVLKKETFEKVVRRGMDFFLPQTRWQMIFIINNYLKDFQNKEELLIKLIEQDNDPNVQKAALDALADVNPEKAERYALKTINGDDIFMVSLSLDVLRRAKSEKLNAGVKIAEEHAFRKISDPDELIRLNALVLLQQLNSDKLDAAIEKLKEDKSLLIQDELRKIRKSNS